MKTVVSSADAPAAIGPYSQAIEAGQLLFCSGQLPIAPKTGNLIGEDVSAQARQVLENLGAVLKAAGTSYAYVVKTTVFLTDLNDFTAMNQVYGEFFSEASPARSTVQVAALPKGAKVEIEAIALKPS
ncbi:MAG: RidA family protein [Verrucomicrobia bacterium]|nr:RidA family protein [Verrucomicrobiota bacterium]MBV8277263.1 RidA family protein [Verrucomicrobiota bacterium]